MKRAILVGLFLLGFVVAGSAKAAVILQPGSRWEYTFINPTASSTWNTTTGTGTGGWTTGLAPFGGGYIYPPNNSYDPSGYFNWRTNWPVGSTVWLRTSFSAVGYDLNSFRWDLGVDNGFTLYLNGTQIATAFAEGYTSRWEYSSAYSPILKTNFLTNLNSGKNFLALAIVDTGGLTAFDMQVTGNPGAGDPVPAPAALALLGLGTAGLAFIRRREAQKA